jgi:hypothetical protein
LSKCVNKKCDTRCITHSRRHQFKHYDIKKLGFNSHKKFHHIGKKTSSDKNNSGFIVGSSNDVTDIDDDFEVVNMLSDNEDDLDNDFDKDFISEFNENEAESETEIKDDD